MLSNHTDIEVTKNNAIEHFLYVESFRDEQKRPGRFCDSSNGLRPGDLDFLTLSTNNERTFKYVHY